ncbi:macro domain-containing protein [Rosistilla oblonga]|uniref:type II toxin-antitoxin system antitoxin DNA ADP-ribosyl glycohydrolase DarG n=1 Tax=Rosistilla oblonga TaxID=2527990 RepID=UPI003A96D2F3
MIEITRGDILKAEAEALVNTVNCVGVMGRGIAAQFKKKFEENFKAYKKACDAGELRPGMMLVFDNETFINPRYVVNFPTKNHWRAKSKIVDIESGLEALVEVVRDRKINSIAIPPLGCGLGGLRWSEVRPRIEAAFADLEDVQVFLYEPAGAPSAETMVKNKKKPNMTPARAAMLGLMRRYLAGVMDPFVTLLEVHKLMYFLVEVGEDIPKLEFTKAHYGPYSTTLRHVLTQTEGHFTLGFADGEDSPDKPIHMLEQGIEESEKFLKAHPQTKAHFDRVANLISGFETPYGMELLATVHWVAANENARDPNEAMQKIAQWSPRKRDLFSPHHVQLAWKVLAQNELLESV